MSEVANNGIAQQGLYSWVITALGFRHTHQHLFKKAKKILKIVDDNDKEEIDWIFELVSDYLKSQPNPDRRMPMYLEFIAAIDDRLSASHEENRDLRAQQACYTMSMSDILYTGMEFPSIALQNLRRNLNLIRKQCISVAKVLLQ